MRTAPVVLLGPQRLQPTLNQAVAALGVRGPLAAITAGWEEREAEDQELRDHLGGRSINLNLFGRAEDVFAKDPELFDALRRRRDAQRAQQDVYHRRLAHAVESVRELLRLDGPPSLVDPEVEDALRVVRELDAWHTSRVAALEVDFAARVRPSERPHLRQQAEEIARLLQDVEGLCIAGGHVRVLANRIRLFGVLESLGDKPIFAWSAGAMTMAERIVLFHDSPPQGPGNAEVLEAGFGLVPGVVPLPHAKRRLRLADAQKVQIMARRFRPAVCVALDDLTRVVWDGRALTGVPGTRRLTETGELVEVTAA